MNKTYQKHLLRWGTFGAGMLVFCFGVVLNTKTGLGVAAVNNVPYTISVIEGVSLGTATMMLYLVLVAAQCLLLRALPLKVLLQAPMSVLIGWIVDFFNNHILTFEAQGGAGWHTAALLRHTHHSGRGDRDGQHRPDPRRPRWDGQHPQPGAGLGFWPNQIYI